MIRKQVYITERQNNQLKTIAANDGLVTSEIIRRAMDVYIAMRQDGVKLIIGKKELPTGTRLVGDIAQEILDEINDRKPKPPAS